jgi:hypothetical protein
MEFPCGSLLPFGVFTLCAVFHFSTSYLSRSEVFIDPPHRQLDNHRIGWGAAGLDG